MAITKAQAQKGVRVKLPQTKSICPGMSWQGFEKERYEHFSTATSLLIGEYSQGRVVVFAEETPHLVYDFKLEDLDLYTEDTELSNPTSYPLPEESFHPTTEDPVNPAHYNGKEVFNQMLSAFGVEAMKAFCKVSVYKYLTRAGKKKGNSVDQDYRKAQWYLTELQLLNNQTNE